MIALAFDLILDYLLVSLMLKVFMYAEKDIEIAQNAIIISVCLTTIFIAHLLSGCYAYRNRFLVFFICEHKTTSNTKFLLSLICIALFPFLGVAMAAADARKKVKIERCF